MAVKKVVEAAVDLPDVEFGPSRRAPAGTIGLHLKSEAACGSEHALLLDREFAHVHPLPDGSFHLTLSRGVHEEARSKSWAEPRPLASYASVSPLTVMVYAPRDTAGADVVSRRVRTSWDFATEARE